MKINKLKMPLLFLFLGMISSLGFAPFYFCPLTLFGIGAAYYIKSANWFCYWLFGAGYAVGMFWWVLNSIYVVPELAAQFAIWTVPGIIGIGLFGGIVFAIPFIIKRSMCMNPWHRPFLFAAAWTFVLWLREWFLTGFPWNPIANIAINIPVISNSMSLWGALGLSFVIIGLIASTAEAIKVIRKKEKGIRYFIPLLVFTILLIIGMAAGYKNKNIRAHSENAPIVRIVQPAKSAIDKATHSREQAIANADANIQNLIRLAGSGNEKVDLIVFPETSYPYMIADDNLPFVRELNTPVIIGATSYNHGKIYNSLAVASASGKIEKLYHKSHLVPFGEYRPFGDIIPTPGLLTPGDGPELLNVGGLTFAPAICYEIIFSDSLIKGAYPDVIINITNDTWFGKTPGTYQHLDMVRRYAIESGMPIIRANYSGVSAFIDANGVVTAQLPVGESGVIDSKPGLKHETIYRAIGRDGWMIIILLFSLCGIIILKKKS